MLYSAVPVNHSVVTSAVCKMFLRLQGGYNLNSICDSAEACLSVMLGDRVPALPTPKPPHKRSDIDRIC